MFRLWSGYALPSPEHTPSPLILIDAEALKLIVAQQAGLSQSAFAASIGVPEGTIVNWEHGRRQPSGPAKVLLALLAKEPNLVAEIYPAEQPKVRWAAGHPDPSTMTAEERLTEVGQILAAGILRMQKPPGNE